MKNEFEDDQRQFKLPVLDELEEPALASDVDEMRLDKISQRVTFISILIPVLIIIVLVIAYLDIKKRMTYTEDTGTLEFQKLSSDLESRFSSLSLRQAKLEENLSRFSDTQNQSLAGSNIKIDKINKTLETIQGQFVTQKNFSPVRDELTRQINGLTIRVNEISDGIDQVDSQISSMTKELESQITGIGKMLADHNSQVEQLHGKVNDLNQNKIDQPALDLAIKLATLKIQQDVLSQMDKIRGDLAKLSEKVAGLSGRPAAPAEPVRNTPPRPGPTQPSEVIKEQPIE